MLDAAAGELEALGWLKRDELVPRQTAWTIAPAVFDGRFASEAGATASGEADD